MSLSLPTSGPRSTSRSTEGVEYVWRPQVGPQKALVDCPLPEIFFGGARGGGKTDGVLGKWALKERRYGQHFNAHLPSTPSVLPPPRAPPKNISGKGQSTNAFCGPT